MSQCSACSLACVSSSPPALWTSALGVPVVPDENNTDSGSSKGSRCMTGSAPVSPAAGAAPSQSRQEVPTPEAASSRPGYGSTTTELAGNDNAFASSATTGPVSNHLPP